MGKRDAKAHFLHGLGSRAIFTICRLALGGAIRDACRREFRQSFRARLDVSCRKGPEFGPLTAKKSCRSNSWIARPIPGWVLEVGHLWEPRFACGFLFFFGAPVRSHL